MRTTRQLSITLTKGLADMVKAKVQSGEYASESEVVRDGLRSLAARDRAVEAWLRDQVVPVCELMQADPSRAVTADHIRARIAAKRAGTQ